MKKLLKVHEFYVVVILIAFSLAVGIIIRSSFLSEIYSVY